MSLAVNGGWRDGFLLHVLHFWERVELLGLWLTSLQMLR